MVHFGFADKNRVVIFFCPEDQGYLFEKATDSWRSLKTQQPHCDGHHKLAKMCVVKDEMKASYGRPFFVCSERSNPCKFWMWGDTNTVKKPYCRHGFPCCIPIVKEGVNKDREFFCCSKGKEDSCGFFQWVLSFSTVTSAGLVLILLYMNTVIVRVHDIRQNVNVSHSFLCCKISPHLRFQSTN